MEKQVIIIGAGLVGSLWAVYMAKRGYKVTVYERRSDVRKAEITAGKSINLALSDRGWNALNKVGIGDEIKKELAIPMSGRIMHGVDGSLTHQAYGKEGQAIYSVSRGGMNIKMMNLAEDCGDTTILYNHQCLGVDFNTNTATFLDSIKGEEIEVSADAIFACDGAFSAVRYESMQKQPRFNYSQQFIEDGYKELLLPANEDGSYKLDKNALHIWPRGRFMLIALANEDGSFTCTLFMPFSEGNYSFDSLSNDELVEEFFQEVFPDFYEMMPNLLSDWHQNPLSALAIIRCYPWSYNKVVLMGDSAHATVPFYGQGMNSGFEDCFVMNQIIDEVGEDWQKVFEVFQKRRKPDGDAIQDLSIHNYHVMRDFVGDPKFLLQKKIEAKFSENHPEKWMPLYSQVTFSSIPYSQAWSVGQKQESIMKKIMALPGIEEKWDSAEVESIILTHL
ncbi:MAG: FAD-dependent monooxygenase [Crocinitomicaceae bacterium]|jgi:kynurenine 3-monooxygenase|nr:FAD-dependent monooxygenase [Crocinitomicaceae bacterium]MBT5402116.1 FAD-dependent monooxygenase [Crocinitomicaceae bacterium]MBT6030596.1 FAD-dependent monooxygenase [Crocinitomicaceae bacterium]MBT6513825.1 FAD-dependent monooxygenase [Crocinitomicaceae bacterium]MDG2330459.1 NAD(P)/FAD-dependent oxidoreductase [Flavobacteriales bacterium]